MSFGRLSRETTDKCYIRKVGINRQGYDRNGRYWGIGAPLWVVENDEDGSTEHVRAVTKQAAKKLFPKAKWGR